MGTNYVQVDHMFLNSILIYRFVSWFNITKSGLLWGTLVAVSTDTFASTHAIVLCIYTCLMESVVFAWIKLRQVEVEYCFCHFTLSEVK